MDMMINLHQLEQEELVWLVLHTDLRRFLISETFRAPDMHYIYSQPSSVFSYGVDYALCYAEYVNGTFDPQAVGAMMNSDGDVRFIR